jgi:hypothetical protein
MLDEGYLAFLGEVGLGKHGLFGDLNTTLDVDLSMRN